MLRAYTDAAGLRRLFYARDRGGVLISDRAAVLASVTGARIDEKWLAARLVCPDMPFPLASVRSPYAGVQPVPPGHRLLATGDRGVPVAVLATSGRRPDRRGGSAAVAGRAHRRCL